VLFIEVIDYSGSIGTTVCLFACNGTFLCSIG
jgi:hypothetical protein